VITALFIVKPYEIADEFEEKLHIRELNGLKKNTTVIFPLFPIIDTDLE
jgi:hypothetical protein